MTNFEKITESLESLGEFLASLPVATGPWDEEFHRAFCDSCELLECGPETCPHKGNRPLWWLTLGEKPGEALSLSIGVKAAFPILWGKEYYTVALDKKEVRAPCTCCDKTGKVTIRGVEYECPKCKGNWRRGEFVREDTVYTAVKWLLYKVEALSESAVSLTFRKADSTDFYGGFLQIGQEDFRDMVITEYGRPMKVYDSYEGVMEEVKRLNMAEQEKLEGAGGNG